jgi:hypothetical protein
MLIYNQSMTGNFTSVLNLMGEGGRPGGEVASIYSHTVGKMFWYSLLDRR